MAPFRPASAPRTSSPAPSPLFKVKPSISFRTHAADSRTKLLPVGQANVTFGKPAERASCLACPGRKPIRQAVLSRDLHRVADPDQAGGVGDEVLPEDQRLAEPPSAA